MATQPARRKTRCTTGPRAAPATSTQSVDLKEGRRVVKPHEQLIDEITNELKKNSLVKEETLKTGGLRRIAQVISCSDGNNSRPVIVDIRNGKSVGHRQALATIDRPKLANKQISQSTTTDRVAASGSPVSLGSNSKSKSLDKNSNTSQVQDAQSATGAGISSQNEPDLDKQQDHPTTKTTTTTAKGAKPPTFGSVPFKLMKFPYFSYSGKARNVDLISASDRPYKSDKFRQVDDHRANNSQASTTSSQKSDETPSVISETNWSPNCDPLNRRGYSNISNLFPDRPMSVRDYTNRPRSSSLLNLNSTAGSQPGLASPGGASLARRAVSKSPGGAGGNVQQHSRRNSLTAAPQQQPQYTRYSPTQSYGYPMRRQNSTGQVRQSNVGRSAVGAHLNRAAYPPRPASAAAKSAPASRRRSPSASSPLYYGSAGVSPTFDPNCPVHSYSPTSGEPEHHAAMRNSAGNMLDAPLDPMEPAVLYDRPLRGANSAPKQATTNGASPEDGNAYYNQSSRFGLYSHSQNGAEGYTRSTLAPAGEQLRRILGYQPAPATTRPVHLHPQWAYSRPFIHLRNSSDLEDPEFIRPEYAPYNQLSDAQAIRAVDFHPSGQVYAVGSNSRALRICAYPAEQELRQFNPFERDPTAPRILFKFLQVHRGSIYCVKFNGQGNLLATGSNDQTVHIVRYNANTHSPDGDEYRLTMHDGTVRDLCFIDDTTNGSSLLLSSGAGDNKIYVTDCDTITPYQSMAGHSQMVMGLAHVGGASFVSASQDRTVRFWDLRTRNCTSIVSAPPAAGSANSKWGGPGAPVSSVAVDASGRLLVTGHSDATCMLYDVRGSKVIQLFRPHDEEIRAVSFSPKSYYLLTGGYDGRIVVSDIQGDLSQPLPSVCVAEVDDKIVQAKWHPSDFTFATTSANKTATLWAMPGESPSL